MEPCLKFAEKDLEQSKGRDGYGQQSISGRSCLARGVTSGHLRIGSTNIIKQAGQVSWRRRLRSVVCGFSVAAIFYIYADQLGFPWIEQRSREWLRPDRNTANTWGDVSDVFTIPNELSDDSHILDEIPQYVLDYAPLVHLYSEEEFWPCDIAEHLLHVSPELDYTPIQARSLIMNLTNLNKLNEYDKARHVYLTSVDNVEERPEWLGGQKNIPDEFDEEPSTDHAREGSAFYRWVRESLRNSQGGRSDAPAVLLTVNKGDGIVDAFWFYFYSYNLGNEVLNIRFGNHVGDWEHSLIRFQHGKPKLVYFSEHNFGDAYTYEAVEKIGKRVSHILSSTIQQFQLTCSSPSSTPLPAPTPCTPPQAPTPTSSPLASSMTKPTAGRYGTPP